MFTPFRDLPRGHPLGQARSSCQTQCIRASHAVPAGSSAGFRFTSAGMPKRPITPKAVDRFKKRIRELTSPASGVSIQRMANGLTPYLRRWIGSLGNCETPSVLTSLERWLRRRLWSAIRKQWKRGTTPYAELRVRGVKRNLAATTAGRGNEPWRLAAFAHYSITLPSERKAST